MKKNLALLLALVLVFSTVTVAFAAEEISGSANVCQLLGMLTGDGNGVTAEYLATQPTRLQGAIMFLRLKGLEEDAMAWEGTENFADADQVAWEGGRTILAYLFAHKELGWVGDAGNFNPAGLMTAQSYYKVMLETLGYKQNTADVIGDFTWAGVVNFAAEVGLKEVAGVETFTVNDLATATVEALVTPVKGSEATLAEVLVEMGVVEEAVAIEAGVVLNPVEVAVLAAEIAIGELPAEITLEDMEAVLVADELVAAALELDENAVIENLEVLEAALATLEELQAAENTLLEAVAAAEEAIAALPATITVAEKEAVAAARELVAAAQELGATEIAGLDTLVAAEATVVELENAPAVVESVTSTNLKELVVVFDKAVDKTTAEDENNYLINGVAVVGTAVLQADNKTVVITLTTAAGQQDAIALTVKNVKDLAGTVMTTVEKAHTFLDFTLPQATSIALTGPQTIEITYSEPLNAAGTVLVQNGIYSATPTVSGNKVTVELGAALVEGSYSVKISGQKDFAGYDVVAKEFTLAYAKDTTNVVATVVEAKQTYVIVEFNKAVKGTLLVTNFYHTFTAWNPTTITDVDNIALDPAKYYTKVKLNFPADVVGAYPIPAGTTKLVVLRFKDAVNEVVDQWGNEMTEDAVVNVTVASDNTAPTITKVEATFEDIIEVTFSEDVDLTAAQLAANYTIKDSEGKVVAATISGIVYTSSDYKAKITLSAKLSGGNYTVEVKDIVDVSIAANKMTTTSVAILVTDKTPATIASAVVVETINDTNPEYVYITFSEPMTTTGEGSILDINNYQLAGTAMPSGSKVELFGSNKSVKLTIPDRTVGTLESGVAGEIAVTVGKLADATGNKMLSFSTAVPISLDVPPVVTSVRTVALNKVEIVVNGILTVVPADGIKVDGKDAGVVTTALAAVSFVADETNNITTITGTLVAEENVADAASTVGVVEIVGSKLKTKTGKYMAANADVIAGGVTSKDGIAPTFVAITDGVVANTFTVTFDEALVQIADGLTATEFVLVDKDGKTLVANVDYSVAVAGNILTFTVYGYTGKVTVSTKTAPMYIGDNSDLLGTAFVPGVDNAINAFTAKEVTIQ